MTSIPKDPRVSELRELFRHLEAFRTVYETTGLQEVTTPEGNTWSLWDLEYLFRETSRLTQRQRQAITLYLVNNIREKDAARMMGVSETNPVAMYATLGLRRLLDLMESGTLERFRDDGQTPQYHSDPHRYLRDLGSFIKTRVKVHPNQCWEFPTPPGQLPRVRVRTSSGFEHVSPARVLYSIYIDEVPRGFDVVHSDKRVADFIPTCVNPWHGTLSISVEERRRLRRLMSDRAYQINKRSDSVRALGVAA